MHKIKKDLPSILLVGVASLLILGTLNTGHDWGGDFSSYIMQAQSLVDGSPLEFTRANRFTIENTERLIGPVAYPWGYPAMLAPVYAGFGQSMFALKSIGAVCYLLFLVLLALAFKNKHSGVWLPCLVGLFALNPLLLWYTNRITSDVPFLLVSTLCVVLIGRIIVEKRWFITPGWDGILLGLLIAAAYLIRSNGVVLLATLGISQAIVWAPQIRRCRTDTRQPSDVTKRLSIQERLAPLGLWGNVSPYVSFFAVMIACWAVLPADGSAHMDAFSGASLGKTWYHLSYYGIMPSEFYKGVPLPKLIYLASLPLMIVGVIRRYRSDHHMVIYVLLTFGLYLVWPATQTIRYLFPILPFYISFMLSGLEALQGTAGRRMAVKRTLCIAPIAFVLVCFAVQSTVNAHENLNLNRATLQGPFNETSSDLFSFINQETPPDSTLVFFKPRVMRMITGRKAYATTDPKNLGLADYLIVKFHEQRQFPPEAAERLSEQGLAEQVFDNADFRVYRIAKTDGH